MDGSADAEADAPRLEVTRFSSLPGWHDDDPSAAFTAFRASARSVVEAAPKTRALGIKGEDLREAARAALDVSPALGSDAARRFFERFFVPARIGAQGFVTAYFEPEVVASPVPTERFRVPLYGRPPDLVEVDDAVRPPGWDPEVRFGRAAAGRIEPHPDRRAIEAGALMGRGLEIAWLDDPVDAFFIHVQGSARLAMTDGSLKRISFAGKSGHAYTSIGRLAVERGLLTREGADKAGLEAWLRAYPIEARELMRENRSFIFFRETPNLSPSDGPIGAAGVPLTTGRSLAVDRTLMTFHVPVFVEAPDLSDLDEPRKPFARLLVAQDTGSAIVGPARGDLFFGSGLAAGEKAGCVRHAARMTVLVPRAPA